MRVDNVGQNSFGAKVVLKNQYKDMIEHAPLKSMYDELLKTGTNNVYEIGKSSYTNASKTAGKHELLLNGEKFDAINQNPTDGTFGFVKNFLQKCLDKENSILPQISEDVAIKLDSIRKFINETGLAIENVKKWL